MDSSLHASNGNSTPPRGEIEPSPATSPHDVGGIYASPKDAVDAVTRYFDIHTARVAESSSQLAYATIGANWAVYGNANAIFESNLAKLSMALAVGVLVLNLIGAYLISHLLNKVRVNAESDPEKFAADWRRTKGTKDQWPFDGALDTAPKIIRGCKVTLPLLAGILFIASLYFR